MVVAKGPIAESARLRIRNLPVHHRLRVPAHTHFAEAANRGKEWQPVTPLCSREVLLPWIVLEPAVPTNGPDQWTIRAGDLGADFFWRVGEGSALPRAFDLLFKAHQGRTNDRVVAAGAGMVFKIASNRFRAATTSGSVDAVTSR